jgi:acetyl-CoA C-acetyltransferase
MNENVAIVGVGWTGFRSISPEKSYKELIYDAAVKAYTDAGINPQRDVDSFVTVAEDFNEGTSIFDEYTPDQLGAALKPVHTITGDGLHGIATAFMLIQTGMFNTVVVEGHSKASNLLTHANVTAYAQDPVLNRPLHLNTHFVAGLEMSRYLHETSTTHEQCAYVVKKNRQNALQNPYAAYGANLNLDEVLNGHLISYPLTEIETAQRADGAIVMVLASEKLARSMANKTIWIRGVGWCNASASLESRDWGKAIYAQKAAQMAYKQAGITDPRTTIEFLEIDDTYAYKELQTLEALGFFQPGEAGPKTEAAFTVPDGELPVNVSGGSLGVGNLSEATGLARLLEVVLQLRGDAGSRQLQNISVGLAQSWRGVPTNSGAVVILSN